MMSRHGSQSLGRPRARLLRSLAELSVWTPALAAISKPLQPGGALAGFGAASGESALGPAFTMKGQNEVYHGHFEAIRHGEAPGKEGFPGSLPGESASPQKWLVLKRPSVAGFERPLTSLENFAN